MARTSARATGHPRFDTATSLRRRPAERLPGSPPEGRSGVESPATPRFRAWGDGGRGCALARTLARGSGVHLLLLLKMIVLVVRAGRPSAMGSLPPATTLGRYTSTGRFFRQGYLGTQPLPALALEQHRPRCLRRGHHAEAAAEERG